MSNLDRPLACSTTQALSVLRDMRYGEHLLIIYEDLATLRELYLNYSVERMRAQNEALVILPFYETTEDVRHHLTEKGVNIQDTQKEGSLAIIDSFRWFFGYDTSPDEYLTKFFGGLQKLGKQGVSLVKDLGPFFIQEEAMKLIGLETGFPDKSSPYLKTICCLHRGDFDRLTPTHKSLMVSSHNKAIDVTNTQSIVFEEALAQSVAEAMSIYGRHVTKVLREYLEKQYSIPPETLAGNPKALEDALKSILDSGSRIVERKIIRSLYQKIGSPEPVTSTGDFEQKISEIKKIYLKYYQ